jgi:predicted nucleic acid-binding Zn ribbon protein
MKKAGDVISALFKENFGSEFVETARSSAELFSSWSEIVAEAWKNPEPAAASHSRISELEKGLLLIEADHPGWIMTLQTKQHELLEAAQRRYPELDIRSLAFKLSREPF